MKWIILNKKKRESKRKNNYKYQKRTQSAKTGIKFNKICSFCLLRTGSVYNLYNHICINNRIRRGMSLYTVDEYIKKYGGIDKDLEEKVREIENQRENKA